MKKLITLLPKLDMEPITSKKIIFDANILVRYSRTNYSIPLLQRAASNNLAIISNNYLLSEIHKAVLKNKWLNLKQANTYIELLKKVIVVKTETANYRISPDPKDNYLFDLAIQNNCAFIISDDRELLEFELKPIPVYSSNWFIKHYPI